MTPICSLRKKFPESINYTLRLLSDLPENPSSQQSTANKWPRSGQSKGYNGIDIYGSTYGSSDSFYSSNTAKAQYDARIKSILEYTSPSFGKQWKDLSEVILAFDIQNEPMIASPGKLADNDPDDWICGRAGNMRSVLGSSVRVPFALSLLSSFISLYFISSTTRIIQEGKRGSYTYTIARQSRSPPVASAALNTAATMNITSSTKRSTATPSTYSLYTAT